MNGEIYKYVIIWPMVSTTRHLNYHFTLFGEIIDYLDMRFRDEIMVIDQDAENIDMFNIIKRISKYEIRGIAICVMPENVRNSFMIARSLKEINKDIKILAYGHLPFLHKSLFLRSDFDAIHIAGDPERTIETFFEYCSCKSNMRDVCGVGFIHNGNIDCITKGELIPISEWGFTRINRVPIMNYCKLSGKHRLVINITRGCPFRCPHCLVHLTQGNNERRREILSIKNYLYTIYKEFNQIKIWAANFTLDKDYVSSFCQMMFNNFPEILWECATRVDLIDDLSLLKLMYSSGCRQISLGVEGLSQNELDAINKNYKISTLSDKIKMIQSTGIRVKACVMIGIPRQNIDDVKYTFSFLQSHDVLIRPTIYTPYDKMESIESLELIERFDRKTYNSYMEGLSFFDMIRLLDLKTFS